jgi:acyl-CoA thioester hydrolase
VPDSPPGRVRPLDPDGVTRADFPVLRRMPTRWADQDVYGHVNNAVHYLLIDSAVNGWLIEASGVDVRELPAVGLVVETSCRYHAEIRFPQDVTVGLALEGRGRSSVRYDLALFTDGESPAATARFVHVYVDHETRRPTPVPAEVERALATLG